MTRLILAVLLLMSGVASAANELDNARDHISNMEYEQAITEIQLYLKKNPADVDARLLLARSYAWDNQFDRAVQNYNELLKLDPDNTQYLFGKAQALLWQNKNKEAIPLLEIIIKNVPEESEPWQLLILALQQTGKPEDKERALHLSHQAKARFPKLDWDLLAH